MIEAYYGNANNELAVGMLIDQLGTYLVLSTVGILVAVLYSSSGNMSLAAVGKKILTRITSYNVCYTKLLRGSRFSRALGDPA